MTDRLRTVTVVLDRDYRDDDAEPILTALRMVKGVVDVSFTAVDSGEHLARATASMELRNVLWSVLQVSGFGGDPDRYKRLKELLGVPR